MGGCGQSLRATLCCFFLLLFPLFQCGLFMGHRSFREHPPPSLWGFQHAAVWISAPLSSVSYPSFSPWFLKGCFSNFLNFPPPPPPQTPENSLLFLTYILPEVPPALLVCSAVSAVGLLRNQLCSAEDSPWPFLTRSHPCSSPDNKTLLLAFNTHIPDSKQSPLQWWFSHTSYGMRHLFLLSNFENSMPKSNCACPLLAAHILPVPLQLWSYFKAGLMCQTSQFC